MIQFRVWEPRVKSAAIKKEPDRIRTKNASLTREARTRSTPNMLNELGYVAGAVALVLVVLRLCATGPKTSGAPSKS